MYVYLEYSIPSANNLIQALNIHLFMCSTPILENRRKESYYLLSKRIDIIYNAMNIKTLIKVEIKN